MAPPTIPIAPMDPVQFLDVCVSKDKESLQACIEASQVIVENPNTKVILGNWGPLQESKEHDGEQYFKKFRLIEFENSSFPLKVKFVCTSKDPQIVELCKEGAGKSNTFGWQSEVITDRKNEKIYRAFYEAHYVPYRWNKLYLSLNAFYGSSWSGSSTSETVGYSGSFGLSVGLRIIRGLWELNPSLYYKNSLSPQENAIGLEFQGGYHLNAMVGLSLYTRFGLSLLDSGPNSGNLLTETTPAPSLNNELGSQNSLGLRVPILDAAISPFLEYNYNYYSPDNFSKDIHIRGLSLGLSVDIASMYRLKSSHAFYHYSRRGWFYY